MPKNWIILAFASVLAASVSRNSALGAPGVRVPKKLTNGHFSDTLKAADRSDLVSPSQSGISLFFKGFQKVFQKAFKFLDLLIFWQRPKVDANEYDDIDSTLKAVDKKLGELTKIESEMQILKQEFESHRATVNKALVSVKAYKQEGDDIKIKKSSSKTRLQNLQALTLKIKELEASSENAIKAGEAVCAKLPLLISKFGTKHGEIDKDFSSCKDKRVTKIDNGKISTKEAIAKAKSGSVVEIIRWINSEAPNLILEMKANEGEIDNIRTYVEADWRASGETWWQKNGNNLTAGLTGAAILFIASAIFWNWKKMFPGHYGDEPEVGDRVERVAVEANVELLAEGRADGSGEHGIDACTAVATELQDEIPPPQIAMPVAKSAKPLVGGAQGRFPQPAMEDRSELDFEQEALAIMRPKLIEQNTNWASAAVDEAVASTVLFKSYKGSKIFKIPSRDHNNLWTLTSINFNEKTYLLLNSFLQTSYSIRSPDPKDGSSLFESGEFAKMLLTAKSELNTVLTGMSNDESGKLVYLLLKIHVGIAQDDINLDLNNFYLTIIKEARPDNCHIDISILDSFSCFVIVKASSGSKKSKGAAKLKSQNASPPDELESLFEKINEMMVQKRDFSGGLIADEYESFKVVSEMIGANDESLFTAID